MSSVISEQLQLVIFEVCMSTLTFCSRWETLTLKWQYQFKIWNNFICTCVQTINIISVTWNRQFFLGASVWDTLQLCGVKFVSVLLRRFFSSCTDKITEIDGVCFVSPCKIWCRTRQYENFDKTTATAQINQTFVSKDRRNSRATIGIGITAANFNNLKVNNQTNVGKYFLIYAVLVQLQCCNRVSNRTLELYCTTTVLFSNECVDSMCNHIILCISY